MRLLDSVILCFHEAATNPKDGEEQKKPSLTSAYHSCGSNCLCNVEECGFWIRAEQLAKIEIIAPYIGIAINGAFILGS